MVEEMVGGLFRENLYFLSSLGRYNSERRPLVRQYSDSELRDGGLNTEEILLSDVQDFAEKKKPSDGDNGIEFMQLFEESLLTLPEDINPQDFQGYLLFRFEHLGDTLEQLGGYGVHDLLSFEALLLDLILGEMDPVLSTIAHPDSKIEYADLTYLLEPTDKFQETWADNITLDQQEVLIQFVEGTLPDDPTHDPSLHKERIRIGKDILQFLTSSPDETDHLDFFLNPLFKFGEKTHEIVVPFPEVLVTTSLYRIEDYIGRYEEVQNLENHEKGRKVEGLAQDLVKQIPNENFLKGFHFMNHPRQGESDGLIIFEDSYWSVEVKSHPIFRKIPRQLDLVHEKFAQKVVQAHQQNKRALNYIDNFDDEFGLVYNLTGKTKSDDMVRGSIIVLDGFIPTMFSGNERVDRILGLGDIHDQIPNKDRVFVVTMYDLFELLRQPEINQFGQFLKWRTGYEGDFPVWGYSEREYWAFYFDVFLEVADFEEALDEAVRKEIVTIYISERFNDKSHLYNLIK